ncbi:NUCLEAR CONTROL OF ATPASE PROTEIN 2 [Salix koriyanagi]|uniref:NUCLEAR CONTROL OF ATPASE PROTEIN 2 n=1 Tax=Salix koriyanagi TaxID=2511006 RepID=A0A9Q0TQ93_9ROSI|nr:NUCLEAR CONTROL OF ATPASE PROTEIN 2 [Salix koriyanagi]
MLLPRQAAASCNLKLTGRRKERKKVVVASREHPSMDLEEHRRENEEEDGTEATKYKGFNLSFYSHHLRNRLAALFPLSFHDSSKFLSKFSSLCFQTGRHVFFPRRRRKAYLPLPLPLPSNTLDSSVVRTESSRVYDVLEDIMGHIFIHLHNIQDHLQFWQPLIEASNARKLYFMIFERGPHAFLGGIAQMLRQSIVDGWSMQHRSQFASAYISERIVILSNLRRAIATFLAEVYMEVDRCGEQLVENPEKSFPPLLAIIDHLFSNLEASIGHLHAIRQTGSSVEGSYSFPLVFEKSPKVNQEGSQWTNCEISDAINVIYKNLEKLDSYISVMVSKHQKPSKLSQYWIRHTCCVVGLSFCSLWLLRHSRLMGSPDIDNWIREAKDSTISFFNDHVEQPLLSIRDELFDTFRKRHKGVMEVEEVQLTANSLHRMLLDFSEQTKAQKFPEHASDQEMLEIVMDRYEKELMHPIQNLLKGELAHALLIQVQKLKLDIETAMLELDQILKANEINFAILAALPAFFLSLMLLMLLRAWFKQDTRAEGRGRIARHQRRLLLVEIEKGIVQYQTYVNQGLEKDSQCMFGLVLHCLDSLFHAVEGHAKATGEWQWLRQDIIDLGKPRLQTEYKLIVISRMERVYECLFPSLKRQ